jgi:hypothetical protein
MGTNLGPLTITPEIYLLWDGEPLEALGLAQFLTSASIGSTTRRTKSQGNSKRARKYTRRTPRVSGAELKFIVPDQRVALMFMELFERNARPKITVGFRSREIHLGVGAAVGTYKIDTISWDYPNNGFIQLTMNGKLDKYLGLASYRVPRYYENRKVREIIEEIAAEHDIEVEFDGEVPDTTASVSKPSAEPDYVFLDRLASLLGLSGFSIQPVTTKHGQVVDPLWRTKDESRAAAISEASKRRTLGVLDNYARTVLKFSKLPAFIGRTRRSREEPKITLAYGPGVPQDVRIDSDLILKVSKLSVRVPHLGPTLATSSQIKSNNSIGKLLVRVHSRKGDPKDSQVLVDLGSGAVFSTGHTVGDLAARGIAVPTISEVSKNKRPPSAASPFKQAHGDLPKNRSLSVMFTSGVPQSVSNDLELAVRASMRTRELGFLGEIDVTLNPGFPFLNSPGEVNLIGTYVHDGRYGVEEAAHRYDASGGLVTTLKLLRISRSKASQEALEGSGTPDVWVRVHAEKGVKGDHQVLVNLRTGETKRTVPSRVDPGVQEQGKK